MFYDLNKTTARDNPDIYYFTWLGYPYELGNIDKKHIETIKNIDPKTNVIGSWRAVVALLLSERNDILPDMSEAFICAIIPIIKQKIYEDSKHIQI